MHFFSPILSPICPLVPTSMFHCTAGPLSAPGIPSINLHTVSVFLTAVQGGSARHWLWDYCSKRAFWPPKTYRCSILFINNKSSLFKRCGRKISTILSLWKANCRWLEYKIRYPYQFTDKWSQRLTNSTFGDRSPGEFSHLKKKKKKGVLEFFRNVWVKKDLEPEMFANI